MVHTRQLANIMAVENNLARQFVHVLLNLVVFDHDDHKVNRIQERVKIMVLVGYDILLDKRIVYLQSCGQMTLLRL